MRRSMFFICSRRMLLVTTTSISGYEVICGLRFLMLDASPLMLIFSCIRLHMLLHSSNRSSSVNCLLSPVVMLPVSSSCFFSLLRIAPNDEPKAELGIFMFPMTGFAIFGFSTLAPPVTNRPSCFFSDFSATALPTMTSDVLCVAVSLADVPLVMSWFTAPVTCLTGCGCMGVSFLNRDFNLCPLRGALSSSGWVIWATSISVTSTSSRLLELCW